MGNSLEETRLRFRLRTDASAKGQGRGGRGPGAMRVALQRQMAMKWTRAMMVLAQRFCRSIPR